VAELFESCKILFGVDLVILVIFMCVCFHTSCEVMSLARVWGLSNLCRDAETDAKTKDSVTLLIAI